jgi:cation transport ATPase
VQDVLGGYLEARTLARTRSALKDMLALAPTEVTVFRDGSEINVAPHEVIPGETVVVRPGGRIGVDGAILSGRSAIDESAITGEPIPAEKQVGDKVFAGTVSHNGYLEIHAEGVGADTTLARIIQRVEEAQEAQEAKAPTQRMIERFASWYTPIIIVLAIGAYVISKDVALALTLLVIGLLGFADRVRPDAVAALQALRKTGVKRLVMLTGDHAASAWRVARELGIDEVHAGLLPEQKLEAIKKIQRESGPTAMVGDGINDAPALAAADIGIAMGAAGTDVAIESADIALMADDLGKIPEAIGLARATLNNIRQNVVIALLTVTGLLAGVFAQRACRRLRPLTQLAVGEHRNRAALAMSWGSPSL